jgi:hypothetical protein
MINLRKSEKEQQVMKEKIHTIPVNEGFQSGDECPFCHMEREAEQRIIKYVLGASASYMEPSTRTTTDKEGFCGAHLKKMYDYGNPLGSALIMQTYLADLLEELNQEMNDFQLPGKRSLFAKKSQQDDCSLIQWAQQKQSTCFICKRLEENMVRYFRTFFVLIKDPEFRNRVEGSKGFCMRHFLQLMEQAQDKLPNDQREWFYPTVFRLMQENLVRVKEDLDWFIKKADYRNASADWKNSRDALPRTMQKLKGSYPADPPFQSDPR